MSNIAQDENGISRKDLARFVVEQFNSFVHVRMDFLLQTASICSPNLLISAHEREFVVGPRVEAWRGSQRVQHQEHFPDVLV